jgi:hypothetical protein
MMKYFNNNMFISMKNPLLSPLQFFNNIRIVYIFHLISTDSILRIHWLCGMEFWENKKGD